MPLTDKKKASAYNKAYYKANKEKMDTRHTTYYKINKEKISTYNKIYNKANKEKMDIYQRAYYKTNREKIIARVKSYEEKNKKKIRIYQKNRYKINPKLRLNGCISRGIYDSLKNGNGKNGYHWETLVPYNLNDLIKRLKKTLPEGYAWDDYINGKTDLHIDHIIPIAVHNFKSYTDTDFQRCWALKNLQLLPAKDNQIKHAKLTKHFQLSLLL